MSSSLPVHLLSLLVWLPLLGALALLLLSGGSPRTRRVLGLLATFPSLLASAVVIASFDPEGPGYQFIELHSWIPALGVSYDLGVDGLGAVLTCWLALLATLSLSLSKGGREAPLLLLLETSLLGLAVARDGFLFLSFHGAAIVWISLLLRGGDARGRWLVHQLAGLVFFAGFFLFCYRLALDQTGFPSAELARFRTLVVFPAEERRLFLLAGIGAWVACPLFPFVSWVGPALEGLSLAGRALVLGGAAVIPPYAVVRLALPVTADGAASWSGALALLAIVSVGYAALAPRRLGLAPLVAGLQGLVLAGLTAPRGADLPAEVGLLALGMALGALALYGGELRSRDLPERFHAAGAAIGLAVTCLFAWPLGWSWITPVSRGSVLAGVAILLFVALATVRLVRVVSLVAPGRRTLLVVPVLALWIALLAAPRAWTAKLGPAEAPVAPAEGAAEEDEP